MNDNEKRVESVLFAVGREITAERIASLCSLETQEVETLLESLAATYILLDTSLQLVRKEEGWKLTVKDAYVPLVSSIVTSTELDRPLMDTLAVIAWRYPIVQSDVIKLRSPAAYEHMRQLEEQGFIAKEKSGRTFKVKLTKKFFEYFDLPSEEAKQAFLKQVPADILQEAEQVHKQADEVERLIELDAKEKVAKEEIKKVMNNLKDEKKS
ncbi:MAG: SMC-Scp complex subunit ScpB [Nanoarchaeota archaeon]|nr:SMC-Scp complex subunit ScpB [Nanoarchaeota archaeon]